MIVSECDTDRWCNHCRAKSRVHIRIASRSIVELTCLVCHSTYELKRYSCAVAGDNRIPLVDPLAARRVETVEVTDLV
jgi:hypothetical protein